MISDRAIVSRRFIPPDSGSTGSLARSVSWANSSSSSARRPTSARLEPEVAAIDRQVLADGQLGVQGVLLRDDAEASPDLRSVHRRVHAHHLERPVGDRGGAADHPHRRGLAGPVRSEEAEGFAGGDVEVDAVDRGELAEALGQPAGMDERRRRCFGHGGAWYSSVAGSVKPAT